MAQGTFTLFEEFALSIANGYHDLDGDTFSVILVSDSIVGMETTATPDRSDFTEVTAGGGYSTGGITLTTPLWTESGGVATFDHAVAQPSITWTAAAGSPTNIKTALLVNDGAGAIYDCLGFIDMTADGGSTAISLVAGNITITWGASGIFTVTV
ncbi:MAG TPA: hypothetical protein ENJ35_04200 [Gammaproteobacteria bacterium]|nr:hypothetical protein [Gammaproteobacteria bacterium]